jgi:3-deoxy-7-phosphoheptulonate synthase
VADAQQPDWPDDALVARVAERLAGCPPLVSPQDCDRLRARLAEVAAGAAFLIQGGDCAETFSVSKRFDTEGKVRVLTRMAAEFEDTTGLPVVTVGRIAGQYAKPRSAGTESRDGATLPVYRGDAVNGTAFTAAARTPDPHRMLRAYRASAATLEALAGRLFTSHEALLLPYERALTRLDPVSGRGYGTSGHLLWIGERTRRVGGPHVEFAAGIRNPVAVKLGPDATSDEVLRLVERLDPNQEPGRLTLITRLGADRVRDLLPPLVEKVEASGGPVSWVCDPMHANTITLPGGRKTRHFDAMADEVTGFFEVHRALRTHPGGLHLEVTGEDVTECLGGARPVTDLRPRYETVCDPRLNPAQAVELARLAAELLLMSTVD